VKARLLLVEDEQEMLRFLERFFRRKGYETTAATSGEEAWRALSETEYDLVISDMALPGLGGLDLLKRVRATDQNLPFIIITGVGTIESAVDAIKIGAFHYVTKPFKREELENLARRAVEFGRMHRRIERIDQKAARRADHLVLGGNRRIQEILQTIDKISGSGPPVLILGETGTGKTFLARYIHQNSPRHEQPFLTIDCGALPENLLESELFGHVKGAFTGAVRARRGLLEEAHGGTVFLDEIGELTPSTQVKLLRAVHELEIRPVGGNQQVKIDVRLISATNRDLKNGVAQGTFREDLYYRLAVIPLEVPPLRERREDLLQFVGHFVSVFNLRYNKNITKLSPRALQAIMELPWKGNIRELKNVIERAVLMADGQTITLGCLGVNHIDQALRDPGQEMKPVSLKKAVEEAEKKAIRRALALAQGNRSQAALFLGIGRRTLYDKIAQYRLGG